MYIKQKNSKVSMYSLHSQLSDSTTSSELSRQYSDSYYDDDDDDDEDDEDESFSDIVGHYFDVSHFSVKKEYNAVKWVLEKEAYCFNVKKFAEKFVDATLFEANKILTRRQKILAAEEIRASADDRNMSFPQGNESLSPVRDRFQSYTGGSYSLSESSSVCWPKISEFNIKLGLEKVENYVRKWERSDDWEFCVEFLGFECEDCSNIFVFEVEWSKPTESYPIPQATASVYFALEVFKMVPHNHDRSVRVTYIFECSNVIHHPGKIDFQEKWLQDIIDAKLKVFKSITFSVSNHLSCRDTWPFSLQMPHLKIAAADCVFEFLSIDKQFA